AATTAAGEAGIAGRRVLVNAQQVLHAQNIQAVTAVGAPAAAPAMAGLGSLTGGSALTEATRMAGETLAGKQAAGRTSQEAMAEAASRIAEGLVTRWVRVEVLGFEDAEEATP
ncbi:MAG: hypothetical protein AB1634_17510, partial [Thermodesulfobacteriota bacterium]